MKSAKVFLVVAMTAIASSHLHAQVLTLVPNRASISAGQTVDWTQLGPAGTIVPQPFQATTNLGFQFTVYKNNSPTPYIRANEGNGFQGDFMLGEPLLYSTSLTAIDFQFATPIQGIGAQLQRSNAGNWTPFLRVITVGGGISDFTLPQDTNNLAHDGSAPFVGIMSTSANITEVLFDSFFGGNTAINNVTISVPEPNSMTLGGIAFVCLIMNRVKRQR